jgi:hypothetical protein
MNTTRASRPIPLGLTLLVACFSAFAALALTNGHDAQAHGNAVDHDSASAHSTAPSAKQVALRVELRRLWEDHITWTRLAVISLTSGSPDTDATVARLLRNQADIGNAVKPFYGKAAGTELTRQLRQHILIAADVIAAAKAGDAAKLADAQARWVRNADTIAAVLNSVNPRHWKLAALETEMHMHLDLTTQEVVARLKGDWKADVAAYDKVHRHILHMSDVLAAGLVEQFPARFR